MIQRQPYIAIIRIREEEQEEQEQEQDENTKHVVKRVRKMDAEPGHSIGGGRGLEKREETRIADGAIYKLQG